MEIVFRSFPEMNDFILPPFPSKPLSFLSRIVYTPCVNDSPSILVNITLQELCIGRVVCGSWVTSSSPQSR